MKSNNGFKSKIKALIINDTNVLFARALVFYDIIKVVAERDDMIKDILSLFHDSIIDHGIDISNYIFTNDTGVCFQEDILELVDDSIVLDAMDEVIENMGRNCLSHTYFNSINERNTLKTKYGVTDVISVNISDDSFDEYVHGYLINDADTTSINKADLSEHMAQINPDIILYRNTDMSVMKIVLEEAGKIMKQKSLELIIHEITDFNYLNKLRDVDIDVNVDNLPFKFMERLKLSKIRVYNKNEE